MALLYGKYVSLTTFRKNGEPVATPVEFYAGNNTEVFVRTSPESGKVKRIRNNPEVTLAPCTLRGKITGPVVRGKASLVEDDDNQVYNWMKKKYGMFWVLGTRLRRPSAQYIRVDLPSN